MWRSTDLRRALGDAAGLEMSASKMSTLWSDTPISIRLDDLEVICSALGCGSGDLLVQEPHAAPTAVAAPPNERE